MSGSLLFRNVEIAGWPHMDCRVRDGIVVEVGQQLAAMRRDPIIDGKGGALLPGLADHHLHLAALAAHQRSVDLTSAEAIEPFLYESRRRGGLGVWLRAVGWDEHRHGDLDRYRLDSIVGDAPARVQHRSGSLWVLSSRALDLLGIDDRDGPVGADRDRSGRPTGLLWRSEDWLRERATEPPPDFRQVGEALARFGLTTLTDATPDLDETSVDLLAAATRNNDLPQRLLLLGAEEVASGSVRLAIGPRKIVVGEHALPEPDQLTTLFTHAHRRERSVAVHCVSRESLALAIAALRAAGPRPGDRFEHCALADASAVAEIASLGVVVVTQPTLVARRGDDYLDRHEPGEHGDLWRHRSLLDSGIATVVGSDAPYGHVDPWRSMRDARDRLTHRGKVLGMDERVPPAVTLAGLLADPADPGGPSRTVDVGAVADVVLLSVPLSEALTDPDAGAVAATYIAGRAVYVS